MNCRAEFINRSGRLQFAISTAKHVLTSSTCIYTLVFIEAYLNKLTSLHLKEKYYI